LFRSEDCPRCDAIQEALEEQTLAHNVQVVQTAKDVPDAPEGAALPILVDEGKVFSGSADVLEHVKELEQFKAQWEKFQTDACYCDDEGNIE
jgi:hypothetical protein